MSRPARTAGYVKGRERGAEIVALPSVFPAAAAAIRTHGTLYRAAASVAGAQSFSGRGAAYRMSLGGEDAVVRHYRRGGAVAFLLRDRYPRTSAPRPMRELEASVRARARGVDTPEVLAAVVYGAGAFYRGDIATRFEPHTQDLAAVMISDEHSAGVRERAWHTSGALLRRAFAAGLEHADLNLRNVLVTHDGARALLIDLDRARVHDGPIGERARAAMVERLHRSRRKLESSRGFSTSAAELAAFAAGLADS